MKKIILYTEIGILVILFVILVSFQNRSISNEINYDRAIIGISERMLQGIKEYENNAKFPRSFENNALRVTSADGWISGFYVGSLWYAFELTKDDAFKKEARYRTSLLNKEQFNNSDHDIGFKMFCSYGNALRLDPDADDTNILIQSARTLITRYNDTVGCIRSWDHNTDKWHYPVIIDNLMNLELLMWAFKETGDSTFYKITVTHADNTLKNHFRKDYSTYHVVDYDALTGEVISKNTHQGYACESAWARGQAWALYGYTMLYRETGLLRYLETAQNVAEFILTHKNLPKDRVPYWDFDDPTIPEAPRDASSAAIIASALYELAVHTNNNKTYLKNADKMLKTLLSDKFFAWGETSHSFLLNHSTGHLPKDSEIDTPIIYADYYLLEALLRKKNLKIKTYK